MAMLDNDYQFQNYSKKLLTILSNLKFAIFILLIIAGFSILGTVIEQNQVLDFYKENYPENSNLIGFINWKTIKLLSLDNVYRSWWYLSLLVTLGVSLISCTFTSQLPTLKISKAWKFFSRKSQLKTLDLKIELPKDEFSSIIQLLTKQTYNIFQYKDYFFCYKGIIGRIAPIVVHISIIQIFLGAIIGATFGYGGQEFIPKSEIFHLQNILNSGEFSSNRSNIAVRVNNFWIDYVENEINPINQYYSDISLLNPNGEELRRKVISVNNPLHYKDLTLYQSDWDILGIRASINDEKSTMQYQTKKVKLGGTNRWLAKIYEGEKEFNVLLKDLTKNLSLYDKEGNFLTNLKENETYKEKDFSFTFKEVVPSTGIDLKSDPGIPFVYSGFVFLIISTLCSFISFSKVWIFAIGEKIYIGGNSNRAKVAFERYFLDQMSTLLKK